jgi:tRNA uridine 5-carboxymethylaminomethyl modification enzyme
MPHEVQEQMVHSLPGLENAVIAKYAYAIEYDAVYPTQLWPTLETKKIPGLYLAGQVNGTSGYEEAACQGLMAGINASLKMDHRPPFVLRRDEAYIGVLIDDLVTKGTLEPYRMLTSRAEFRLLLRHDNADLRLTPYGYQLGLISEDRYQRFMQKKQTIDKEIERLKSVSLSPSPDINQRLETGKFGEIKEKTSLHSLLKRPGMTYAHAMEVAGLPVEISSEAAEQVEIEILYEGYIVKARKEAEKLRKEEGIQIPAELDYDRIHSLALEARAKLKKIRPLTIGQASRISGINPSDIAALVIAIKSGGRN